MKCFWSNNEPLFVGQASSCSKIVGLSMKIGNFAACLVYNQNSTGMVPDLVQIPFLHRQSQIDVSSSTCNRCVFCLRVQSDAFLCYAQLFGNLSLLTKIGMSSLHAFAKDCFFDVGDISHFDR